MTFSSPVSADARSDMLIATVQDHALLLFLPQADGAAVWRFDLDVLAEHGFRLIGRDGFYDLELHTLHGDVTALARFIDKQEAHQTLQLIHSALRRAQPAGAGDRPVDGSVLATCPTVIAQAAHGPAFSASGCRWTRCCRTAFGWLTFWRAVFLVLVALVLFYALRPGLLPPAPVAALPQPGGVPLDADTALPD